MVTRKLLHYFTDHKVMVVTSYPLGDIVRNHDTTGWISMWALELMGHDIRYIPRTTIKSQALTDFVAEWMEVQLPTLDVTHEYYTMYFDGSVMVPGSGAGVVLISPDGSRLRYSIYLHFWPQTMPRNMRPSSTDCTSPSSSALCGSTSTLTRSWSSTKS